MNFLITAFRLFCTAIFLIQATAHPIVSSVLPTTHHSITRADPEPAWFQNQSLSCASLRARVTWSNPLPRNSRRPNRAQADVTNRLRGQWEKQTLIGDTSGGNDFTIRYRTLNRDFFGISAYEFNCFADRMWAQVVEHGHTVGITLFWEVRRGREVEQRDLASMDWSTD